MVSISKQENTNRKLRTAHNPETREQQLIALAIDNAEEQLRNKTASSQLICHYLKLGSMKEKQEREKLEEEIKLLKAKTDAIKSAQHVDEMYAEAIAAMKRYNGTSEE